MMWPSLIQNQEGVIAMGTPCHRCKGEGKATVSREESHDLEKCPRCEGSGEEPHGYDHRSHCVLVTNDGDSYSCLFCKRPDTLDTFSEAWDYRCPGDEGGHKGLEGMIFLIRKEFEDCDGRNVVCDTCVDKRPECQALDVVVAHASSYGLGTLHY